MTSGNGFMSWIVRDTNWSRAGIPAAVVLTLLSPFIRRGLGKGGFSVYLQLPIYMAHQYEEHGHSAFKESVNQLLASRNRQITDGDIFLINIGGVWCVDLIALYLARYRNLATGLLPPYIAIVNSLVHLGAAGAQRRYNPGALTSGLLLLPGGIYSAVAVTRSAPVRARDHVRAAIGAIVLHAVTFLIILRPRGGPRNR